MSDNKKYYYLKLKEDFFDSEEMKVLESMKNGVEYQNVYLKMCLLSLKSNGALMFKNMIPYSLEMLSSVLRVNIDTIKTAIEIFKQMELITITDTETIYMSDIQTLVGQSSTEAERIKRYRQSLKASKSNCEQLMEPVTDTSQIDQVEEVNDKSESVQMYEKCTENVQNCTPEYRDKSIEIRDKSLNSFSRTSSKKEKKSNRLSKSELNAEYISTLSAKESSDSEMAASLLISYLSPLQPTKHPENNLRTWQVEFAKFMQSSGVSYDDLIRVINFSFATNWQKYIFAAKNLIDNYDKIYQQMTTNKKSSYQSKTLYHKPEQYTDEQYRADSDDLSVVGY